ncbi:MAG: GNAT family N-acetyltransferase [Boseongicola sp.]|nr:GNAT family N-acetyltransferase [Boseongicola sp.]
MKFTDHHAADSPDPNRDAAIAGLLDECFDSVHGGRTFFKQAPHQRLLAWSESGLVGHVGMDFRVVRAGEATVSVLGIVDLCVAAVARRQGIGASLLQGVEERAEGQSFALAMADDSRLYRRAGYSLIHAADVTFLAIDELRCQGVVRRDLSEIFMVKRLGGDAWPDGPIDLLGNLF